MTIKTMFSATMFGITSLLMAQNKLDENGLKNGAWKGIYEDTKNIRYEGVFEHGKEKGEFLFYENDSKHTLKAKRTFNEKDNSVYTEIYDAQKLLVSEGKSVNKLNEGLWKYYHKNAKVVMIEEFYRAGKLEGERKVFFPNGAVAEISNFKNGKKNGPYLKKLENGIELESSNFLDDEYHGKAVYKDPNGNIVAEGEYKNGKKSGIWNFYVNGKLSSTENFDKPRNLVKPKNVKK